MTRGGGAERSVIHIICFCCYDWLFPFCFALGKRLLLFVFISSEHSECTLGRQASPSDQHHHQRPPFPRPSLFLCLVSLLFFLTFHWHCFDYSNNNWLVFSFLFNLYSVLFPSHERFSSVCHSATKNTLCLCQVVSVLVLCRSDHTTLLNTILSVNCSTISTRDISQRISGIWTVPALSYNRNSRVLPEHLLSAKRFFLLLNSLSMLIHSHSSHQTVTTANALPSLQGIFLQTYFSFYGTIYLLNIPMMLNWSSAKCISVYFVRGVLLLIVCVGSSALSLLVAL